MLLQLKKRASHNFQIIIKALILNSGFVIEVDLGITALQELLRCYDNIQHYKTSGTKNKGD